VVREQKRFNTTVLDGLSLIFIGLHVPALTIRLYSGEAALYVADNMTFMLLCRVYTSIVREQKTMNSRCCGSTIYIQPVQYWGKHRTLRHYCKLFLWA
jgi:hypothetical protein